MAAARQKEMNVSITEDATISLTRSEGGAAYVLEDAILMVSARLPAFWSQGGAGFLAALAESISESITSQSECCRRHWSLESARSFVIAEQLFCVFNKADEHHHR